MDLNSAFESARQRFHHAGANTYQQRRKRLLLLKKLICENRQAIIQAISQDFTYRAPQETELLGILPSLSAIHYHVKNLRKWMKVRRRKVPWYLQFGKAQLRSEPKGVVGIIVPWNYPLQLTILPLLSALAAGNVCLLKISEYSPCFAQLFQELIARYFPAGEVTVICGDADCAHQFSLLPFDHLFFTGSTATGKKVMRAASENLTPVTLELGGKSPVIITRHFPLKQALEIIMHCKLLNAGQTCVAPDYVMLPDHLLADFIRLAIENVTKLYPDFSTNQDHSALHSETAHKRLNTLLFDAKQQGAQLIPLVKTDDQLCFVPHLLINPSADSLIMQQEIFGPLLPVITYKDEKEIQAHLCQQEKPLALYYFDKNKRNVRRLLEQTQSGGVVINGCLLHAAINDLPFGGVGASGMGCYHAEEGFKTFSHQRAVFYQGRFNAFQLLRPPYTKWKQWLIKLLSKLV